MPHQISTVDLEAAMGETSERYVHTIGLNIQKQLGLYRSGFPQPNLLSSSHGRGTWRIHNSEFIYHENMNMPHAPICAVATDSQVFPDGSEANPWR